MSPSRRAQQISESITLAIAARAKAMQDAGRDVISLGAGEPDFATPEPVARAGIDAIREGRTRYTATSGIPELRKAAADWLRRTHRVPVTAENVMVTAGAKPALTMALTTIVEPGDKVLLLAPYWVSYPDIIRLAGGVPVVLPPVPEQGFVHTAEQIGEAAAEHRARGILINFPNNPSGAVPSRATIEAIVEAAIDHDMWIVSDEIYSRLVYDGREHVSPASLDRARDRVIVVNGGTKSHSMTGWRIGFCAGPRDVIAAAGRIQSQTLGNPCTISQYAALEFCRETDDHEVARRVAAFDERRRFLVEAIGAIPHVSLEPPQGAFYALVGVRDLCERRGVLDDVSLAELLLNESLVATVPGTAFDIPGHLRLSYAASLPDLGRALDRIRKFANA